MHTQQWLLFGHLIGVVVLFGAIMLENVTVIAILRARDTEQMRSATTFARLLHGLFPVAVVLLLGFGIGMVAQADYFKFGEAWIDLSLGLLIVLAIAGPTVQGRRIDAIADAAREGSGPLNADLAARVADPVLSVATFVSTWLALGIVFLMTRRPGWTGAWLAVVVFGAIGLVESVVVGRLGARAAT
jgi:uncharacterized membrane protein